MNSEAPSEAETVSSHARSHVIKDNQSVGNENQKWSSCASACYMSLDVSALG